MLAVLFLRAFGAFLRALPASWAWGIGKVGGRLAYAFQRRYVRRARAQLARAMPELSARRVRETVRGVYEHLGLCVVEFLRLPGMSAEDVLRMVEPEGVTRLKEILGRGKGALFVSGHIGNWELSGQVLVASRIPLVSVTRPGANRELASYVDRVRSRLGQEIFAQEGALRGALRALKEGKAIGILMDQDGKSGGVFVPFFGVSASTVDTAARLALKTGCAVVPVSSFRRSAGSHELRVGKEIDISPGEGAVERILTDCNAALEGAIREHLEQWFWFHRRWRTRQTAGSLRRQ